MWLHKHLLKIAKGPKAFSARTENTYLALTCLDLQLAVYSQGQMQHQAKAEHILNYDFRKDTLAPCARSMCSIIKPEIIVSYPGNQIRILGGDLE